MEIPRGECTPETLVRLKKQYQSTLSYAGLVKKATFLDFAQYETFKGVRWRQLEEKLFGEPPYKRFYSSRKNYEKK
jgi:hypothetical protein